MVWEDVGSGGALWVPERPGLSKQVRGPGLLVDVSAVVFYIRPPLFEKKAPKVNKV